MAKTSTTFEAKVHNPNLDMKEVSNAVAELHEHFKEFSRAMRNSDIDSAYEAIMKAQKITDVNRDAILIYKGLLEAWRREDVDPMSTEIDRLKLVESLSMH